LQISIGDWISFLNTAKQCWNAERSEAIERHEVPLEFIIAAMRLYQKLEVGSWKLASLRS
jgi:hypothetical protein